MSGYHEARCLCSAGCFKSARKWYAALCHVTRVMESDEEGRQWSQAVGYVLCFVAGDTYLRCLQAPQTESHRCIAVMSVTEALALQSTFPVRPQP